MDKLDDGICLNVLARDKLGTSYDSFQVQKTTIQNDKQDEGKSYPKPNEYIKKAAFLVKEGKDNEKFDTLPSRRSAHIAYRILHNPVYYWLALILACGLLLLVVLEYPSKDELAHQSQTDNHNWIDELKSFVYVPEIAILLFFTVNLILRLIWLGPKLFIKSRAILVLIIVIILFIGAIIEVCTDWQYVSLIRILRPFILLDTYLMSGARRVIRQIILCLKYIIDVMLALFFIVAVFSLIGYFIFKEDNPTYFRTLNESMVTMIITLTTANHPDVFMESYNSNKCSPIFFMIYMFITYYYFLNVLLAVVYAKFKAEEKKKCKKLFIHKREALYRAFDLLKDDDHNNISFLNFFHLMKNYSPHCAPHEITCLFKVLKSSSTDDNVNENGLTWNEFSKFYNYENMKWELIHSTTGIVVGWYEKIPKLSKKLKKAFHYIHIGLNDWFFDIIIAIVVVANLLFLLIFIICHEKDCSDCIGCDQFCAARKGIYGSFVFNTIYLVEVNCRLFFDGPKRYFRKWWNWIDYMVIMSCFICLCVEAGFIINYHKEESCPNSVPFIHIAIVRPLKLIRLLRLKKSYFFLIRILIVLAKRLISVLFVLIVIFYIFSIIGMEVFAGGNEVKPNCCINASFGVGEYYLVHGLYQEKSKYYWLNNFNDTWSSVVTLYEQMVVNNWFIQMEGFVSTTSQAARLYFILFWINTILVVNIAIVYIVDAFDSALNLVSGKESDSSIRKLKKVIRITLTNSDARHLSDAIQLTFDKSEKYSVSSWIRKRNIPTRTIMLYKGEFRGKRMMNNDDLRVIIYESELEEWSAEYDEKRATSLQESNEQQQESLLSSYRHSTKREFCKKVSSYLASQLKRLFYFLFG